MAHTDLDTGVEDGWPWNCTRCGTTIYHDAVNCKSCEHQPRGIQETATSLPAVVPFLGPWIALMEWIDAQSYTSLVAKFSTIAGLELLLTALWLRILFLDAPAPSQGLPI